MRTASIPLSAGDPRWAPRSEAELRAAVEGDLLEESHYLGLKEAVPEGRSGGKETAREMASLSVDGGTLIIGIGSEGDRVFLVPQPLKGAVRRIEQIARLNADPPLDVRVKEVAFDADPTRGFLVVGVPASPLAPHMVDGRYYGRGDTGRYVMPDVEVVRLHEGRRNDLHERRQDDLHESRRDDLHESRRDDLHERRRDDLAVERPQSAYVTCLRRLWTESGSAAPEQIAARCSGQSFPIAAAQVEAYLLGEAIPESSLELHVLLYGIAGGYGAAWSKRPEDPETRVERAFRLWREVTGAPEAPATDPLPAVRDAQDEELLPSVPRAMEVAVEVATYLGAAGVGGIIGNRADSVVVRAVSRLFQSVQDRWRAREADTDGPLSEDEAVDAAIAAALTHDHALDDLRLTGAEQRPDGSWRVLLAAPGFTLRVMVPVGDPAEATLLLVPE